MSLYQKLEHALTDFFHAESALLLQKVTQARPAVTQALTGGVTHGV